MTTHEPSSLTAQPGALAAGLEQNHRILIVDDNEAIHEDFRKILGSDSERSSFEDEAAELFGDATVRPRRVTFDLDFAFQGQEALTHVEAACRAGRRYALVFMDVRMPPGWDGLETTLKLWEADPDLQIVLCTAYSDYSWDEMMGLIGTPERLLILKKPFDTVEVLQLAHALSEKWSLLQAARTNVELLERTVRARTRALEAANELTARARDAALESSRIKAVFLTNVSHELRTPMNGIIGMTQLLEDRDLDAEERECTELILQSAAHLLAVINNLLDFSKIENGSLALEVMDFDLEEVVWSALDPLSENAQSRHLELATLIAPGLPTRLRGDAGALRQVLLNLLGNAIKFTPAGEVALQISQECRSGNEITLRFELADTGIGIPPEAQLRLFDSFQQADGSTTRKYGGTGLGLTIARHLTEKLGGAMGLKSTPGRGSLFWFTACFQKQPTIGSLEETVPPWQGRRVLIVEDHARNAEFLCRQLIGGGVRAETAASGSEALRRLRAARQENDPFKVALLDLHMPEMTGLELGAAIRGEPELAGTALLLLTDFAHAIAAETLSAAGIAACQFKPVRMSELFAQLARLPG